MSRIRRFFSGVGALVLVILLLPELVPFFGIVSDMVGGVPGTLMLVVPVVILLAVLYGMWSTSQTRDRRRAR